MLLSNLLKKELVILDLKSKEKIEVIEEIVDKLAEEHKIQDKEEFLKNIIKRENLESSGIGKGIALPHAVVNTLKKLVIAFACSKEGVNFAAQDGKPVHLIFMLGSSEKNANLYLNTLARIASLLRNEAFKKSLLKAKNAPEIINLIKNNEK